MGIRHVYNKTCYLNVKTHMTRCCSLALLTVLPCLCFSQIGLNARYFFGKSDILSQSNISQDGVHAALEYNFRLEQKRIEFRPGAGYRYTFPGDHSGNFSAYDLDFGTAIYPFDFAGDCDCPTFSKEGNLIKKGFFLEFIPGVSYQTLSRKETEPNDPSRLPIRSKNFVWKIGGAAGLDIGITDRYTITPMFSMTMLSSSEWEGLLLDGSSGKLDDYVYMGGGLRLTYNAEEKRRRRN